MGEKAQEKQIYLLESKWRAARDARNRTEADGFSRQILRLIADDDYRADGHRTYLCDSLLYRGELDKAAASYLKLVPRGMLQETEGYAGLARIAAERRDFARGLSWLERYAKAPGAMCGNCIEWRRYHSHVLSTVWKAAMQPAPEASLRQIIGGGGYAPLQMRLRKIPASLQQESVAQEARLILAEYLMREKRIPEAKELFRELMDKVEKEYRAEHELFLLAEAHLKRLG